MKPRKLIRYNIVEKLKLGEFEELGDKLEINNLYGLKIKEELLEIQSSDHSDINEFADLIQVAYDFAKMNGFTSEELEKARHKKLIEKGPFGRLVLTNLNPNNPSNKLYFELNDDRG